MARISWGRQPAVGGMATQAGGWLVRVAGCRAGVEAGIGGQGTASGADQHTLAGWQGQGEEGGDRAVTMATDVSRCPPVGSCIPNGCQAVRLDSTTLG